MKYVSTRNVNLKVSGSFAIANGIAEDGGLYVPETIPTLLEGELTSMIDMSYPERVAHILSKYLDEFTYEELCEYAEKAYSRFDDDGACPVVSVDDNLYFMELYHGPTLAFKDLALTLLPYLMSASVRKLGSSNKTLVLVATSGDTGKAALAGFMDVENTGIIVFYPNDGVSNMQKLQMTTQEGNNVFVSAIKGNFDDAQTAVKAIFADEDIKQELSSRGYTLSSANSINWGRLAPQICYYVSAYLDLVDSELIEMGDKINFAVPTGNFGNILAGYYAKKMGLPIGKLICASNQNNILTDFFYTGEYDTNREFFKSISPSMDILVSSNLERLLFEVLDRDSEAITNLYSQLKSDGVFTVNSEAVFRMQKIFVAGYATEADTQETISGTFDQYDYVIDPHTAVANYVYNGYVVETDDDTPTVIVSTANPYKFPCSVYESIVHDRIADPFKALRKLNSISGMEVPASLSTLQNMDVRFDGVISREEMAATVLTAVDEFDNKE